MKFPSKIITYKESSFYLMILVLQKIKNNDYSIINLYQELEESFNGIGDFIEIIESLYALNKIKMEPIEGIISYVK